MDTRIPTAFVFILIAGTQLLYVKNMKAGAIVALLTCIFFFRMGVVVHFWDKADIVYHRYERSLNEIEGGSRVFSAIVFPGNWRPFPVPLAHIPCLAVIKKSAFVPSLFAFPTQQPIAFSPDFQMPADKTRGPNFIYGRTPDWKRLGGTYDYMFIARGHLFEEGMPSDGEKVYKDKDFCVIKLK